MIRVGSVRAGSIGDELAIGPGTLLLQINGRDLRDALDLRFYESDEAIELLTRGPGGEDVLFDILKEPDESLGLVPSLIRSVDARTPARSAS